MAVDEQLIAPQSEAERMLRLAYRVASSLLWAIVPDELDTVLAIAARENMNPQAVAARLGRPLENTYKVENRDGIAIIPIHSTIFRRASMFSEISGGAASVQRLATDFNAALADPAIKGIIFDIDSPGGEANGISEFAQLIERARAVKPVKTYVGGNAGSAAFHIAVASKELVTYKNASVGSIGVMAVFQPDSGKRKYIISQKSPNKNLSPDTAKGEAYYQAQVDKHAQTFIDDVAHLRGVTSEVVERDFGMGAMVIADEALTAGMIDRIGTFEDLVAEMQDDAKNRHTSLPSASASNDDTTVASLLLAVAADESTLATERPQERNSEEMGMKEIVSALLASGQMSDADKAELVAQLTGAPAQQATTTGGGAPAAPAQQPAPQQPAPQQFQQQPAPAQQYQQQAQQPDAQLQAALERAVKAECSAFVASMMAPNVAKVTPGEQATVETMYQTLAKLNDGGVALNQYKASIEARPSQSGMMTNRVAANGQLHVLPNVTNEQQTPEQEAAEIGRLLSLTPEGTDAFANLRAGKIQPAAHA